MQNNYNKLINNLESLNLNMFKANLSTYLEYMENGSKTVIDILYELSEMEMTLRTERAMNACVKVANFPFIKTLMIKKI